MLTVLGMDNVNKFNRNKRVLTLSFTFWVTKEHLYRALCVTIIRDSQVRETLFNSLVFSEQKPLFHLGAFTQTAKLELKGNTDDKPIMAHP
jgi:hypothetical protein